MVEAHLVVGRDENGRLGGRAADGIEPGLDAVVHAANAQPRFQRAEPVGTREYRRDLRGLARGGIDLSGDPVNGRMLRNGSGPCLSEGIPRRPNGILHRNGARVQ